MRSASLCAAAAIVLQPYTWQGPYAAYRDGRRMPHLPELCFRVRVPGLPGGDLIVRAAEMLCSRDRLLYDDHLPSAEKFPHHGSTWSLNPATGALSSVNRIPGDRTFTIGAVPRDDGVALDLAVENLGTGVLHDVSMAFCVIAFEAPGVADREFRRTYLHTSRGFVLLAGKTAYKVAGAPEGGCGSPGLPAGVETAADGIVFLRAVRGSPTVALGMDRSNVIFANPDNACFHADPFFGDLRPGETKHARGEIFITARPFDEVLAAFRARFR